MARKITVYATELQEAVDVERTNLVELTETLKVYTTDALNTESWGVHGVLNGTYKRVPWHRIQKIEEKNE